MNDRIRKRGDFMIYRPDYIKAIKPFINQPIVKILCGVRRSGKSTIFEMIKDELKNQGIKDEQIIVRKYTEMDIPEDLSAKQMYDDIVSQMKEAKKYYVLLDEVQEIPNWEKSSQQLT